MEQGRGATRSSIRNKIMMAFIVIIVAWGAVQTFLLQSALTKILSRHRLPFEILGEIANRFTLISTGLTLAGIVLFLFVALYFSRALAGPIRDLTRGVSEIARGRRDIRVPIASSDELGLLAEDFNDMVEALRRSEESLRIALEESEGARRKIDVILQSVADGLIVTDAEGRTILVNPSAERTLKISAPEALGRPLQDLFSDLSLKEKIVRSLHESGEGDCCELQIAESPGAIRTLQIRISLFRDQPGMGNGRILILHDVTQAREIDRMKSEFISTVSHELRTPLAAILGFSELLQEEGFSLDQRREFTSHVLEKAEHLARLVDELLDISRIEEGRGMELNRTECTDRDMLEPPVAEFRARTARHRIELALPARPVGLVIDRVKMLRVMENLISNAVKYSPSGGTITVSGRVADSLLQVEVADEGIGMNPDQVEKIFDKFYRADASNTAVGGVGLGMSIVRNIVQAHAGTISVESSPGKGTKVTFTIPLASAPA